MVKPIRIAGRMIGPGNSCFIIAEAGVNHNGSLSAAHTLIDTAVEAGADAIKFQTFVADRLATPRAAKADYQRTVTDAGESQLEMLRRLELSSEDHQELMAHCREKRILFLSAPFDEISADLLDQLGVTAFKIPSGELTNLPFLEHVARKGKPMIVSTGMSTMDEVKRAVKILEGTGHRNFALLHCVSSYPADPADVNLRAMQTLLNLFNAPVGYSDHTLGVEVALAAAALGACVIEKHFTLDRTLPGPDQKTSLEPKELASLVRGIRTVEAALGHGRKEPAAREADTLRAARKSLVSARDIAAGTTLTEDLIAVKRPGTGLSPDMRSRLIGRIARVPIPADTVFTLEMLS